MRTEGHPGFAMRSACCTRFDRDERHGMIEKREVYGEAQGNQQPSRPPEPDSGSGLVRYSVALSLEVGEPGRTRSQLSG